MATMPTDKDWLTAQVTDETRQAMQACISNLCTAIKSEQDFRLWMMEFVKLCQPYGTQIPKGKFVCAILMSHGYVANDLVGLPRNDTVSTSQDIRYGAGQIISCLEAGVLVPDLLRVLLDVDK